MSNRQPSNGEDPIFPEHELENYEDNIGNGIFNSSNVSFNEMSTHYDAEAENHMIHESGIPVWEIEEIENGDENVDDPENGDENMDGPDNVDENGDENGDEDDEEIEEIENNDVHKDELSQFYNSVHTRNLKFYDNIFSFISCYSPQKWFNNDDTLSVIEDCETETITDINNQHWILLINTVTELLKIFDNESIKSSITKIMGDITDYLSKFTLWDFSKGLTHEDKLFQIMFIEIGRLFNDTESLDKLFKSSYYKDTFLKDKIGLSFIESVLLNNNSNYLEYCLDKHLLDIDEIFKQNDNGYCLYHYAVVSSKENIKFLINRFPDYKSEFNKRIKNTRFTPFMMACETDSNVASIFLEYNLVNKEDFQETFYGGYTCLSVVTKKNSDLFREFLKSELCDEQFIRRKIKNKTLFEISLTNPMSICYLLETNIYSKEELKNTRYSIFNKIAQNYEATKKVLELDIDQSVFRYEIETIFKSINFKMFLESDKITTYSLDTSPPFLKNCLRGNICSYITNSMQGTLNTITSNLSILLESDKFTKELFNKSIDLTSISRIQIIEAIVKSKYFDNEYILKNIDTISRHYLVLDIYKFIIQSNKIVQALLEETIFLHMSANLDTELFLKVAMKLDVKSVIDTQFIKYIVTNKLYNSFETLINNNKHMVNIINEENYKTICSDMRFLKSVLECKYLNPEYLCFNKLRDTILDSTVDKGGELIKLVIDKLYQKDRPDMSDRIVEIFFKSIKLGLNSVKAIESFQDFSDKIFTMHDNEGNNFLHHILNITNEDIGLDLLEYYKNKININIVNTQNNLDENCLYTSFENSINYSKFLLKNKLVNKDTFKQKNKNNYSTFFRCVATDDVDVIKSVLEYIDKDIFDSNIGENGKIFSYINNTLGKESFLKDKTLSILVDSEFFDGSSIDYDDKIATSIGYEIKIHIFVKLIRYGRVETIKKIVNKLNKKDLFELEDELGNSVLACSYQYGELFKYILNHPFMTKNIFQKISKKGNTILTILSNRIDDTTYDKIPYSDLLSDALQKDICDKDFIEKKIDNKDIIMVCKDIGLLIPILLDLNEDKITYEFVNDHTINSNVLFAEIVKSNRTDVVTKYILSNFFNVDDIFRWWDNIIGSQILFEKYILYSTTTESDLKAIDKICEEIVKCSKDKIIENILYPFKDSNFLIGCIEYEIEYFFKVFLKKLDDKNINIGNLLTNYRVFLIKCMEHPKMFKILIESKHFIEDILYTQNSYGHKFIFEIAKLPVETNQFLNIFNNPVVNGSKSKYSGDYDDDRIPMMFGDSESEKFNYLIDKNIIDKISVKLKNKLGENSLIKAVKNNNLKIANCILKRLFSQDIMYLTDIDGKSFMHYVFNDKRLINRYIDDIINLDVLSSSYLIKDKYHKTPLNYLIENGVSRNYFELILCKIDCQELNNILDIKGNNLFLCCCEIRKDLLSCFYNSKTFDSTCIITRDINHNSVLYKLKDDPDSLQVLVDTYNVDTSLLMKYHSDNGSVLIETAQHYPKSFKIIIENIINIPQFIIMARDRYKESVLHKCFRYNAESLKVLLDSKLDLEYLFRNYSMDFNINHPLILACQYNPEAVKVLCESSYGYMINSLVLERDIDENKYAHFIALECQPLALCYLIESNLVTDDVWNVPYSNGYKIINHIKIGNPEIYNLKEFTNLEFIREVNEITDNEDEQCDICGEYKTKIAFTAYINCSHKLCVSCAVRPKTCPFCRAVIYKKYIKIDTQEEFV